MNDAEEKTDEEVNAVENAVEKWVKIVVADAEEKREVSGFENEVANAGTNAKETLGTTGFENEKVNGVENGEVNEVENEEANA